MHHKLRSYLSDDNNAPDENFYNHINSDAVTDSGTDTDVLQRRVLVRSHPRMHDDDSSFTSHGNL
jgi:hypothetical protein